MIIEIKYVDIPELDNNQNPSDDHVMPELDNKINKENDQITFLIEISMNNLREKQKRIKYETSMKLREIGEPTSNITLVIENEIKKLDITIDNIFKEAHEIKDREHKTYVWEKLIKHFNLSLIHI